MNRVNNYKKIYKLQEKLKEEIKKKSTEYKDK